MKKTACLLVLCSSMLVPTPANADDGGFWDMLFHWHTKFSGYGTDFHLVCLTDKGRRISKCEQWFKNFKHLFRPSESVHEFQASDGTGLTAFEQIKHEFNIRTTYFHSYGQTIPAALLGMEQSLGATRACQAHRDGMPSPENDRRVCESARGDQSS